jgi:phosphoglycolate phosphatase
MKRLILYDLDGTLVDTLRDIAEAVNHMLHHLQVPPIPSEEVRRYVGWGVHELVQRCLKTKDAGQIERGVELYRAHYSQHLLDYSRLYPGAQMILEHFKARDQAVITNKPNPYSRQILEGLRVAGYFVEVIAGDSEYPRKPNPAAVLSLMRRRSLVPHEVILLGDSPIDMETGKNAGVPVVGIAHGLSGEEELAAARPDLLVRNFAELLEIAKARGW